MIFVFRIEFVEHKIIFAKNFLLKFSYLYFKQFSYGYVRFHQLARYHAEIREWEAQKFIHKVEEEHERAKLSARNESEFIMQVNLLLKWILKYHWLSFFCHLFL